jgi:hypothetical protein
VGHDVVESFAVQHWPFPAVVVLVHEMVMLSAESLVQGTPALHRLPVGKEAHPSVVSDR